MVIINSDLSGQNTTSQDSSKTILIIEDDPLLLKMYLTKFENEGFTVLSAMDGEEGLKLAQEKNIDLLIVDLMMPKLSGTDLLEKLKTYKDVSKLPILVLTNLTQEVEKSKLLMLGVNEYLVKSDYTPSQVVEIVRKYI